MRAIKLLTFSIGLSLVAGCTSLRTLPDAQSTGQRQALQGIPYSLPMRQYALTITRTLKSCAEREKDRAFAAERKPSFEIKVAAEPSLVAGERYVVDYNALRSLVKTSDFAIETYAAGTLKSVNVSADDRSAEVIKAVAKTGLTIAGLPSLGRGLASGDEPEDLYAVQCRESAQAMLDAHSAAEQAVEAQRERIAEANNALERAILLGATTRAEKEALFDLMVAQRKETSALEDARKALEKAAEPLSAVEHVRWPTSFDAETKLLTPSTAAMRQVTELFELRRVPEIPRQTDAACAGAQADLSLCLQRMLAIYPRLEVRPALAAYDDQPANSKRTKEQEPVSAFDRAPDKGIFIRPPVEARLVVCSSDAQCGPGEQPTKLIGEWMSHPQLGQLRFLPFENRMFENNALILSLREDGALEKFQYSDKAAIAERLASTASDLATQYKGFREAEVAADKLAVKDAREALAAERAEQVAALTQRKTLLTLEKELTALENPTADPQADLKKATLALRAEEENIRAKLLLLQAQDQMALRSTTP